MVTLASALENAAERVPERTALVFGDLRQTYAELDATVNRVASVLAKAGLGAGERCAVMGVNTPGFVYALFATAKLGAIFVPVNPRSAPPEVAHILRDSGARVLVVDPALVQVATAAIGQLDADAPALLCLGAADGYPDLLAEAVGCSAERAPSTVTEQDDAMILYTSGTTGFAKGVLMDHHRLVWTGVTIPVGTIGMTEGASLVHVAPLYHSGEMTMMLIPGVLVGATHVILSHFDAATVLDTMERERTTIFFGVPTMYQMLLAEYLKRPRDLSAWRSSIYGAAPMPPEVAARLQETFADVRLFSCYGPTEAGPSGFFSSPQEAVRRPEVTGYRAFPLMRVRVVDAAGKDVAPGEVGEVLLAGETVMKGYWRNPAATEEAFLDGWLRTGDLARLDSDGAMTIVDRLKDMIISGGRNIYCVEVENAVASHPAVADCAVVGRPDPVYGETVVACVTLAGGQALTLDELRAHCAELIADYKLPRELIFGPVPRNPSGKILKRVLREGMATSTPQVSNR
ncbi:class I adenylate-forming enzyme family protein [Phytohabitans kaempferiae]|uniref:Class I adenylate-forming enzyme family protein n=1 Tax=Phytohabitans kaempferiae TaxID=1620943 RepID=A0ABV6M3L7_9ACTN